MSWITNPEKEQKVRKMLDGMNLKLEKFGVFDKPGKNYFWLTPEETSLLIPATKRPPKTRKNWKDTMNKLYAIRNYGTHFANIPTDNFLNTFDTFEGDPHAVQLAKSFLEAEAPMRGIWLHGPTGIGKSHLLTSMLFDFFYRQGLENYGGDREKNMPSEQRPVLHYHNYMEEIHLLTHYRHRKSHISDQFGDDLESTIYFLDDACERQAPKILDSLLTIHNKRKGRVAITSNYSLNKWIALATEGRSPTGVEGRLRTYIKEFEITGENMRKNTW